MTWDLEARNKCAKSFLSRMPAAFYTKYTDLRDVYYSTFESLKSKNLFAKFLADKELLRHVC